MFRSIKIDVFRINFKLDTSIFIYNTISLSIELCHEYVDGIVLLKKKKNEGSHFRYERLTIKKNIF